jgi:hypothetical protein
VKLTLQFSGVKLPILVKSLLPGYEYFFLNLDETSCRAENKKNYFPINRALSYSQRACPNHGARESVPLTHIIGNGRLTGILEQKG